MIAKEEKNTKVIEKSLAEFNDKIEVLISKINSKMLDRADINSLVGVDNIEMMKDNHSNHARFIYSILKTFDAEQLVDTVLWVFRAYRSRGFHSNYWAAQLNTWIEIYKQELSSEAFNEIVSIYV